MIRHDCQANYCHWPWLLGCVVTYPQFTSLSRVSKVNSPSLIKRRCWPCQCPINWVLAWVSAEPLVWWAGIATRWWCVISKIADEEMFANYGDGYTLWEHRVITHRCGPGRLNRAQWTCWDGTIKRLCPHRARGIVEEKSSLLSAGPYDDEPLSDIRLNKNILRVRLVHNPNAT